jgi:hypothetical protein
MEKKTFSTRSNIDKIDDYLREHGFTISRDPSGGMDGYTLRKDIGTAWLHQRKFFSKKELIDFANNL